MQNEDRLREFIRKTVRKILDEISTTGGVAGYLTPNAFTGGTKKGTAKLKKVAQQFGYTLTKKGLDSIRHAGSVTENVEEEYIKELVLLSENLQQNVEVQEPVPAHRQLGKAISEINRQIKMIEMAVLRQNKFKMKENLNGDQLWKRTLNQLIRLESRLLNIARQLREIRN